MFVVCVTIRVVPEHVEAFLSATRANFSGTRREPKNVRFDLLRARDEPGRFFLYEVYQDEQAFREHQQTAHYLTWRDAVAPWMAEPRAGVKHESLLPDPWV